MFYQVLLRFMKIADLTLENPLVLAPMAGITQLPFRRLVKEQGCGLVVTEMVSSNGLVYGGHKSFELLRSHPSERPLSVQIFGRDPEIMKEAARIVESQGADLLDINLGCSVRKVVRQGAGVALMREPKVLEAILRQVRAVTEIPITVKIRSGWEPSGEEAMRVSRIAEDCGIDAVAVHPRTAVQGFGGKADWSLISRLKNHLSIPVIGNGDILGPEDVLKMQSSTGCDAMMIGRASKGNPWIFSQSLDLIDGKEPRLPDLSSRLQTILRYIDYMVDHFGEFRGACMMRSHLLWFVKGLPGCSSFRDSVVRLKTRQEMIDAIGNYFRVVLLGMADSNVHYEGGKHRMINVTESAQLGPKEGK